MPRLMIATLFTALVLAGCGGSSGSGSGSDSGAKPTKSGDSTGGATAASKTYFSPEDTATINKPAAAVQLAGTTVRDTKRIATCNTIKSYPRWRKCWHALLDPYSSSLNELARVFLSLRAGGFSEECSTELKNGAQTFSGFATKVEAVAAGIDSDKRADQVASGKAYGPTMDEAAGGFVKPFQDVTRACYSPKDLASINASPSPSPTP